MPMALSDAPDVFINSEPVQAAALRVPVGELMQHISRIHLTQPNERHVFLILQLHRSDRLQALAQQDSSRLVHSEVSRRIKRVLRSGDFYSFVSSDEVWVFLANLPSEALAKMAARTLRDHLSRSLQVESQDQTLQVHLRPIVGGAWAVQGEFADCLSLITAASDSLSKARGHDEHVVVQKAESSTTAIARNALERDLRLAIHGNEMETYFQPQVAMDTGQCISAEALIRWRRDGQFVSPALIASICEERGLMNKLTLFVLNSSLRQLSLWKSKGFDLRMSINLSAITMADDTFPEIVAQAMATWGVAAEKLTLELTESSIVQNEAAAIDFMNRLNQHGCRLAIDDFGTGYSSFAYLRKFPLDELKIDQSFVRNCASDAGDMRIVQTLVDLAHGFGLKALAEGVEDKQTLEAVRKTGCDEVQGFFYSKALPSKDFLQWCIANKAVG
jgi:diguanylate cyclase